jgi:hypothetical protein
MSAPPPERALRRLATAAAFASIVVLALHGPPAIAQGTKPPALQKPNEQSPGEPNSRLPNTGENLSERLDRSEGVITPPAGVDPEMTVRPKEPGAGSTMPVIPPPAPGETDRFK